MNGKKTALSLALSSAFAVTLVAAVLALGCETSSTVTAGPDPVKCQVSLTGPPLVELTT